MRLGIQIDASRPIDEVVAFVRRARDAGFASAWSSQIFAGDTLTQLAVVGREVDAIELGTSVVPVQPRHAEVLALQARTVQEVIGGRLTLGIGLSHQVVVEHLWGLRFERPAAYMAEYLDALLPMVEGKPVDVHGEFVTAVQPGRIGPDLERAPSVILAALGPRMLELAGSRTDGTTTWMTGITTLREYVVPTLCAAAADAGRASPRVVAKVPFCLTDDRAAAAERIDAALSMYTQLPSYRSVLDKEGAEGASDVSIIGPAAALEEGLAELADAGVTDAVVTLAGNAADRAATLEFACELAAR